MGQRPVRDSLGARGATPVIPTKSDGAVRSPVDPHLRALRNRSERASNEPEHARRIATRYDQLANGFFGFVRIASIRPWTRFVHRT
jgi:transposase